MITFLLFWIELPWLKQKVHDVHDYLYINQNIINQENDANVWNRKDILNL